MFTIGQWALIVASQSFILSVVIITIGRRLRRANIFLSLFLIIESLRLYVIYGLFTPGFNLPLHYMLWCSVAMAGPCLYLYVVSITQPDKSIGVKSLLHLSPWLITVAGCWLLTPELIGNYDTVKLYYKEGTVPSGVAYISIVVPVITLCYVVPALKALKHYRIEIEKHFSELRDVSLGWLTWLLLIVIVTNVAYLLIDIFRISGDFDVVNRMIVNIVTSFIFNSYISIMGMRQAEVFVQYDFPRCYTGDDNIHSLPYQDIKIENINGKKYHHCGYSKYDKSKLDARRLENIWQNLESQMQTEKLYLDPDLCLKRLAELVGESPHNTSQAINIRSGGSFYDYVNEHRIRAAAKLLSNPKNVDRKMFDIYTSSGFSSTSTFYTHFNRTYGMTPKKFKEKCLHGEVRVPEVQNREAVF